jgi:hypothetical protein
MFISPEGAECPVPGRISFTITVPAEVPLVFQSSNPVALVLAAKKRVPFTFVRYLGELLTVPAIRSRTSTVPADVPLDFQISVP